MKCCDNPQFDTVAITASFTTICCCSCGYTRKVCTQE